MTKLWVLGQWAVALSVAEGAISAGTLPAAAQESTGVDEWTVRAPHGPDNPTTYPPIPPLPTHLSTPQPATTVEEWLVQIEASLTQITGVQIEETEAGLQIVLETAEGELATPTTQTVGNALIADIPNAVLALPESDSFEQFEPAEGIALVQVTNEPGDRVRVAITGTDAPPVGEVTATGLAVMLGEAVAGAEDDAIQVVVTGEEYEGYNPSSASTATRTETPLRDIPQSIQVVPQQVLEDRNVNSVSEALETVSGVAQSTSSRRIIRGFIQASGSASQLRDGYRSGTNFTIVNDEIPITVERVEVLKGPGSVLFGAIEPGGVINTITKRPLSEPYYNLSFEAGNEGIYQPSIDLSGPLSDDNSVLYRFIAAYNADSGYFEGGDTNNLLVAPSVTLNLGDQTSLYLNYEYARFSGDNFGLNTGILSDGTPVSRDIYFWGNQDLTFEIEETHRYRVLFEHSFDENLRIRSAFSGVNLNVPSQRFAIPIAIVDDRFVEFDYLDRTNANDIYFGQIDLIAEFDTGSVSHQLVAGVDTEHYFETYNEFTTATPLPNLDLLNPNYDVARPTELVPGFKFEQRIQSYGVYLQNQIEFSDNLKMLIGGRYDWVSDEFESLVDNEDTPATNSGAFSPRIGLVYQPSEDISLYSSYSRSFRPTTAFSPDQSFEPTRGTQYEIGARFDLLDDRLSTNLAAYHLTRTNVSTTDPDNPLFSVQTGEQRSQGIELDISGEILPGWNIIASYAYTDAEVTEDNDIPVGNQLVGVPFNQASLWTTYEIQEGDLEGLGFGLGLFYVGERQGDSANSFELDSYLRTDAALYYRKDNLNAAINIRNLFDVDYIASSDFFSERGEPFTIIGSISWEF